MTSNNTSENFYDVRWLNSLLESCWKKMLLPLTSINKMYVSKSLLTALETAIFPINAV